MPQFYNTLTRQTEELKPLKGKEVGLYTCGPTVYNFAHIGNLRTYIFEDLLRRTLEYDGYKVIHAMNITDVGHLVSDADEGEDKMEVGAKREGKHPLEIAKFYTEKFFNDLKELNILMPTSVVKATDAIPEQLEIIKILMEKGFAYKTQLAIYFDVSKFPEYGKLAGQKLEQKTTQAREEVYVDAEKNNRQDFALWFFLAGRYKNHILHWPSPWGEGFPGWHIECSAISRKVLGQPFDIHTGGEDHIGTHHPNEMAQSEAAFGVPLANIWMHGRFLQINDGKMAKSAGTFITLSDLKAKGFSPLDYRYLCLTAHYRAHLNFTWENLLAAHNALEKMYAFMREKTNTELFSESYVKQFREHISNDLNIPQALALAWEMIDDKNLTKEVKQGTLLKFDKVFGLNLANPPLLSEASDDIKVKELADARTEARNNKDFKKSDELRKQIEDLGYEVMDTPDGQKIKKKLSL
jgi:cysteinyl-tRNA synthetase